MVRIDPATLIGANLDPECLQLIEATDLLCYLVMDTSFYTKSAKKLKENLDDKIKKFLETCPDATNAQPTYLINLAIPSPSVLSNCSSAVPSKTEMETLFAKLNKCKIKPVALSLIQLYCEQVILKSRDIPTICNLFQPSHLDLTYTEL